MPSSPGRSVTRARRLYESRLANSVKATDPRGRTVHMKWESRETRPQPCDRRAKLGL